MVPVEQANPMHNVLLLKARRFRHFTAQPKDNSSRDMYTVLQYSCALFYSQLKLAGKPSQLNPKFAGKAASPTSPSYQ